MAYQSFKIRKTDKDLAAQISEDHEIDPFLALLLVSRGMTQDEEIDAFLHDDGYLCDPMELPGMKKAVDRIRKAVDDFEKIAVYGDFDADGVTATVVLYSCLSRLGADVMYYIPDREEEGYGLNAEALRTLKEKGVSLIITVDNGISAINEAEEIKNLSMELVITDHHLPPEELPSATAIVDPHCAADSLEFCDWAGVGVAFKLVCALCGEEELPFVENLIDLVALGTISDVVPLLGENRTLVRLGLARLNAPETQRPGLKSLLEECVKQGRTLSAQDVAFTLSPRINAAGRMYRAEKAAELLLLEEEEPARELAQLLCQLNAQRQELERRIIEELEALFAREPQRLHQRVLVAAGEGWHPGVLGIVAARVMQKYGKPTILFTYGDEGEEARGSGRSVEGFSLHEALTACSERLIRFGGHAMAAGLTLKKEDLELFSQQINAYAEETFAAMPVPSLLLDCKLSPASISLELLDCLEELEPYGAGNPAPVFGLYQMRLEGITPIGSGRHLRLNVARNGVSLQVLRFGVTPEEFPYRTGDSLDLAVTLSRNEYNGRVSVSIQAVAVRLSGINEVDYLKEAAWYEASLRGEHLNAEMLKALYPDREACALIYRYLTAEKGWAYAPEDLYFRLKPQGLTLGQVHNALKAFVEMGLLSREETGAYVLCKPAGKVDLLQAPVLQALRAMQSQRI